MMRAALFVLAVWVGNWALSAEPIADVRSLRELQAAKSLPAGQNWSVKLGVSDSGEQGGPWILIYCWAQYAGSDTPPPRTAGAGEPLGPVNVHVAWNQQQTLQDAVRSAGRGPAAKEAIYCMAVPVARKGTCRISIRSAGGADIASRDIVVDTPRECYWHTFAVAGRVSMGQSAMRMTPDPVAAIPVFGGLQPLLRPGAEIGPELMEAPLPARVPLADEWIGPYLPAGKEGHGSELMDLHLKNDLIEIDSPNSTITNRLDSYMLARWWVNGKPLAATPEPKQLRNTSGMVTPADSAQVPLCLPATLGNLVAGDKVTLQLLYSPNGVEMLSTQKHQSLAMGMLRGKGRMCMAPMLSNRLEFQVTPAMLAGR